MKKKKIYISEKDDEMVSIKISEDLKPKPMTISVRLGSEDEKLFIEIVNQGIDSRLEAFTDSLFRGGSDSDRLYLDFAESELSILLRRLSESNNENAEQWEDDILLIHYGVEII